MKNEKFSLKRRIKSFRYAFNGLRILIKEEHNSRIHLVAAICVCIAGFIFEISASEWLAVVIAIGLVFILEIVNSAIENIADLITIEKNLKIKKIKDLMAAAVLVGSITALIIAIIIFIPKFITIIFL